MRIRKTTSQFVQEACEVWGDRWDYSLVAYETRTAKIKVLCREHGEFSQSAGKHLEGQVGCAGCNGRLSLEDVKQEALQLWGGKWDFSHFEYKSGRVTARCPEHDYVFSQQKATFFRGEVGCPFCNGYLTRDQLVSYLRPAYSERIDLQELQLKSGMVRTTCLVHGDPVVQDWRTLESGIRCTSCIVLDQIEQVLGDRVDYSTFSYKGRMVTVRCKEHERDFTVRKDRLLSGQLKCSECKEQGILEEARCRAAEVWGTKWDLSSLKLVRGRRISARCPEHGIEFTQMKGDFFGGIVGCYLCRGEVRSQNEFVQKSKEVWGDGMFDYSETHFTGYRSHITLTCQVHGVSFSQMADSHLRGSTGCRKCYSRGASNAEDTISSFLQEIGMFVVQGDRSALQGRKELDLYLPEKRLAFEFNGVYWHSNKFKDFQYHYEKFSQAQQAGIQLYQIWEDDWDFRRPFIERHIKRVLGVSDEPKIAARKTQVQEIEASEAKVFLEANHIQGFAGSSVYLGLFHQEELVAVATFKRSKNDYTLTRYATSAIVQGGHSKLVSYFEKNYSYEKLVTFADLTFGNGDLYRKTGWTEDKLLPPDYMYLRRNSILREHKFNYRLKRFREDPELKYEEGLSESQLAELNGMLRVYDAGKIRFIKPHP